MSNPINPASGGHRRVPIMAFGLSLGLFFVITYLLCIIGYLVAPGLPIAHNMLNMLLPGFELLTVPSFFLGLVESFAFGWYIALVFGPLYNALAARLG
jgi:hypothetical protein